MEMPYTSVEEQVKYGLETIDPKRMVEVPLRDLLYVYQTLGEFVRFFHQPGHYPDIEAVHDFLGDKDAGGFHLLAESYYHKLYDVWPEDISEGFTQGRFDNLNPPDYQEPAD